MFLKLVQFRLRTLLIFVTLFGCLGGWLSTYAMVYQREVDAIERLFDSCPNPQPFAINANGNNLRVIQHGNLFL